MTDENKRETERVTDFRIPATPQEFAERLVSGGAPRREDDGNEGAQKREDKGGDD